VTVQNLESFEHLWEVRLEELSTTIHHTNDVTLTDQGDTTKVTLHVSITEIGPKAKLAALGTKWGYESQLDALDRHLGG
jgi:hypothetical protein